MKRLALIALLLVGAAFAQQQSDINRPQGQNVTVTATQPTGTNLHMVCDSGCAGAGGTQDVNLKNYNGSAVGAANAFHVQPGTGAVFTVTWPTALHIIVDTAPTTPVTGTFWQATQPVSGTFWQATQPVSGTFWQATQPVSIASMPSTPVTGTFWPTAAGSPASVELSDGSAFYTAAKSSQLPAALDGSGYLKTHEQGTANVSVQNATLAVTQSAGPWQVQSNSANLATESTHASIKTNTDPLVAAGGGGYVRQDSTATIAKESGGNLATLAAKDFATSAKQDTGNTSLGTIATNTTGASTAARQDTGNTSAASLDAKTPALVNSSQPVVIMSAPAAMLQPVLTQQQMSNPLLYKAAMQKYCSTNLCPNVK